MPCFVTSAISSSAFYQYNNHYINFSALSGSAKCHWKRKSHICGDLEKRKLPIDIIYRLLRIIRIISLLGVTLPQIIVWGHKGGLENKINEQRTLKNWSKRPNWSKYNNLRLMYPVLAVDEISLNNVTESINNCGS